MLLAIDVGNTQTTLGLYPDRPPVPGPAPRPLWRYPTRRDASVPSLVSQYKTLFRRSGIPLSRVTGVSAASVVPPQDGALRRALKACFGRRALFVAPGVRTGLQNLYRPAGDVGADRLVNAAAARARVGGACLVVDFGTATTVDCVDRKGSYLGGVIVPGPKMAAEALARGTARLPLLDEIRRPARVIGRSTQDSLASGLYYGYAGLVSDLVRRIRLEMGGTPPVLATGGLAALWAPSIPSIREVVTHLTLEGLRLIWYKNQ